MTMAEVRELARAHGMDEESVIRGWHDQQARIASRSHLQEEQQIEATFTDVAEIIAERDRLDGKRPD